MGVKSMKDGILVGLGMGVIIGGLSVVFQNDFDVGLKTFGTVGTATSTLLGLNNLLGNRVYVMKIDEAKNRLKVDFIERLISGRDLCFVAILKSVDMKYDIFKEQTGNIIACVDCTLRQKESLPLQLYIKNMLVHEKVRRCGVAKKLLENIESYANSIGATILSLEVADSNVAAVNLYKKYGFEKVQRSNAYGSSRVFGRSFMIKNLSKV